LAATLVRKILLMIGADDGDTEAKLDRINEKADELGKKHPELAVRIDTAAASAKVEVLRRELRQLGKPVDVGVSTGGGGGLSGMGALITGGIVAALAGLPAIAAAGGAATGIALGAALLVGTKQSQGPLYQQFHTMLQGITGIVRTSSLPLVRPLAQAFTQVGRWAQQLKPELTAVFAALGPSVMPLTRGLEGLISGVLPGFLRLMQSARPAVQAFGGMLSQMGSGVGKLLGQLAAGVGPASKFMSGLSSAVTGLLPLVGTLSNVLAGSLAPVMQGLGGSLIPGLVTSLQNILIPMTPLLKSLGQLIGSGMQLAGTVLPGMTGQVGGLTGAFNGLANVVGKVAAGVSWLASHLRSISDMLSQVTGIPGSGIPGLYFAPSAGSSSGDPYGGGDFGPAVPKLTVPAGFGDWAAGLSGYSGGGGSSGPTNAQTTAANTLGQKITAALGSGIRETIPQARAQARTLMADIRKELADGAITQAQATSLTDSVQKALAAHIASTQAAARKLGESLTSALARQIASASSAGTMATAVGKLLADVKTAYDSGIITLSQDRALTRWLDGEGSQLERIAARRAYLVQEITAAKQYAASTASSTAGNYGLSNFATSGINGGPVAMGGIIGTLRQDVAQIRRFGGNIRKLAKAGLDKNYLGQLIALGPVQGGELAAELAASLGDIKTINTLEGQITQASGSIGKMAANIQYEGGKAAGSGFLAELEKQKAALDRAGQAIARALVKELRKDLGAGGAVSTGKVEIRLVGGDKAFRQWLKKMIRVTGGNVQVVGA
jgi:hypothetical protein